MGALKVAAVEKEVATAQGATLKAASAGQEAEVGAPAQVLKVVKIEDEDTIES